MDGEKVELTCMDECVFLGFEYPFGGYSQLPHDWLDEICANIDNIAELKVVLYIFRHTCGFIDEQDTFKHLTIDDFVNGRTISDGIRMDRGTGLSEMSVRNGLSKAIEHGYVLYKTNKRDLGRIRKSYKLKLRHVG